MSVLVIDVGNTRVKAVCWEGPLHYQDFGNGHFFPGKADDAPLIIGSVPTELHREDPRAFGAQVKAFWKDIQSGPVVLVSVVPEITETLGDLCPALQVVGLPQQLHFSCDIENPETVGPDRFCNVAALRASKLESGLVVDAGTATTFDLVLDGEFKGGLIAPGMAFASEQLAKQGAMLQDVPFEARPMQVGRNSREAMMGGAWWTGIGGVEFTIARLLEKFGELPVILTGGLGVHLQNDQRYWDPYWTLRGAACLASG